jgi:hypothetical protein
MIFQADVQGAPQHVLHRAVDNDCILLTSAWVGRAVLLAEDQGRAGYHFGAVAHNGIF